MKNVHLTLAAGSVALGFVLACASAPPPAPASPPATFAEQAQRGATLYADHCASCHGDHGEGGGAPAVVGLAKGALPLAPHAGSHRTEQFATAADIGGYVMKAMPPGKGGSLRDDEYLAILAFDLQANGVALERPLDLASAGKLVIPR